MNKSPKKDIQNQGESSLSTCGSTTALSFKNLSSVEDIDGLTDQQITTFRLTAEDIRRVYDLIVSTGQDFPAVKRRVIRETFVRENAKRPRSDESTPREQRPPEKRQRTRFAGPSFSQAADSTKVAVVPVGFPVTLLDKEQIDTTSQLVLRAFETHPMDQPLVRLIGNAARPGYWEVTCGDQYSVDWLTNVIQSASPWEGAALRTLYGDKFPKLPICYAFVPHDRGGLRVEADRILQRLRATNRELNTKHWRVRNPKDVRGGQYWTFSMDYASLEVLKKNNMRAGFAWDHLLFKLRGVPEMLPATVSAEKIETQLNLPSTSGVIAAPVTPTGRTAAVSANLSMPPPGPSRPPAGRASTSAGSADTAVVGPRPAIGWRARRNRDRKRGHRGDGKNRQHAGGNGGEATSRGEGRSGTSPLLRSNSQGRTQTTAEALPAEVAPAPEPPPSAPSNDS